MFLRPHNIFVQANLLTAPNRTQSIRLSSAAKPNRTQSNGLSSLRFDLFHRPFPSSLVPLFQSESKCETFHMKMSSARGFFFMQIKVIFIRMVSHLDSLLNRGTRELGNGLLVRKSNSHNVRYSIWFHLARLQNSIELNPWIEVDWVRLCSISERSIDYAGTLHI